MYACAYNFPAVLLTLGASKWPVLSKLFHVLLKNGDKIKRPLACALHEIAKIIGEEKAEKELIGILESFLKSSSTFINSMSKLAR
jgi:serine/threonine-protein phosphatase 4 regulatory subunit 1